MIGESIDVVNPDVKALSAPCRSLYERFAKKVPGSFLFVCARAPSGETWSSVASLALPPNEETQIVIGTWQLIVQSGAKVVKAAPAHFQLFASHSGGACQLDPEVCLDYGHYAGLLEPIGFVFVDVDGKPHSEAFVVGSEELENSQAQEVAITLWDLKGNALEMDELTRNAQVAGVADCDGDGLPEFALNPYRSQANAFLFRYGPHYRGTSELWTELLTLGKGGGWSKDDALARRYAARLCPTEETAPFGRPPGNWPGAIHCAKLWGHGSELAAALERACNAPRDDDTRMFCTDNRAALEHMVETDVPRLLPAPPAEPLPRGCFDQAMADGE
ncbi:MAG TPA: hypothetical protein VMI54_18325 [Polyangiaceae bacterium]|nr:hypothetical protein [Polyangiaceae bacterium]